MSMKPEKVLLAHRVEREVDVAVINMIRAFKKLRRSLSFFATLLLLVNHLPTSAGVLPDERVDILEHQYDGGGVQVSGPSILVRKNIGSSVSVSANYYVDMVSSASIDVVSSGSPYSEQRDQRSLGAEYFHDRTSFSLNYVTSDENDYQAKTYSLGVSQTFFGDLTTLGFGFSYGQDVVGRNIKGTPDPTFKLDKERHVYMLSLSQILTTNLIAELSLDSASDACVNTKEDDTCLNNPYRSYSFISETGFRALDREKYPLTHNSDAVGLRFMYHLPFAATLRTEARYFTDSWGVQAQNAELRYTQDFNKDMLFEVKYRVYSQTAADFYSDLFPYRGAKNFMARDKELSPFNSTTIGLGVTYKFQLNMLGFEKSTANLYWDHMQINYDDFRDYNEPNQVIGKEKLYSLEADVIRFFVSFWF